MRALTSGRAQRITLSLALVIGLATPAAVSAAPAKPQYRVAPGDTITSIAVKLRVPGGWEALYRTNAALVGRDPNRLAVGTQLVLPTLPPVPPVVAANAATGAASTDGRYVVRSGDTLSVVADRLRVPGGRNALYTANRTTIGADPNRLVVGTVLVMPRPPAPVATAPGTAASTQPKPAPQATVPAVTRPAPAAPTAPSRGQPIAIQTPPAAEVPAERPIYPEAEPVNTKLLAGLLGAAGILFVLLLVQMWRGLRDPDKRALRRTEPTSGPSSLAAGALAALLRHEVHENQIVLPDQRTPEEQPLRIVLDKPERETDSEPVSLKRKRLSA